jgi:hypothetical protein
MRNTACIEKDTMSRISGPCYYVVRKNYDADGCPTEGDGLVVVDWCVCAGAMP